MKKRWLSILILIFLLAAALILIKNYNESVKGFALDTLNIAKDEIKVCCTYFEDGEEKTCVMLKRFSCDLCEARCS